MGTRIKLLIASLAVGLVLNVQAAIYHVDYATGSDANAGTSTGAPFKRCPGDQQATGIAASTTLTAGDTVLFKGGVTYVLTATNIGAASVQTAIDLSWSGTAGNPITYDGNSAGTWGTGKAIITDNHGTNKLSAFRTSASRSNLTFKHLKIQEIGGSSSLPSDPGSAIAANRGGGIGFGAVVKNLLIDSCEFAELGYYWNAKPMDAAAIEGTGIGFYDGNGVVITNCVFSKSHHGIFVATSTLTTNIVIAGCTFTNSIVWCIDIATTSVGYQDDVQIHHNTFANYAEHDQQNWTGYGEWPHTDGIFDRCDNAGFQWGTNRNFYSNLFYQEQAAGGGTASIYITEGPSANVFNNLFLRQGKSRAISLAGGPYSAGSIQVLRIWNNTFIDNFTPAIDWGDSGGRAVGSKTNSLFSVKNNIFVDIYTGGANVILYSASTTTNWVRQYEFDNNVYYTSNTLSDVVSWSSWFGDASVTQMQSKGFELNSVQSNPLFLDFSAINNRTNMMQGNYRIATNSPAVDVGASVSLLPLAGYDYFGTARPQGSGPDAGYFESGGTSGGSVLIRSIRTGKQTASGKVVWR